MKTLEKYQILSLALAVLLAFGSPGLSATELKQSYLEQELQNTRYALAAFSDEFDDKDKSGDTNSTQGTDQPSFGWESKELSYQQKSPAKAFLFSLAVPGAGQYYYGSKKKAAMFLGIEAVSWLFHIKWQGSGDDLTTKFTDFHTANWTRQNYVDYLEYAHGVSVDTSIKAFTHQLPETNSQQYYEMTGKYDQFLWGWEDAHLDGDTMNITEHINNNTDPALVRLGSDTLLYPHSEKRLIYEEMRLDANNKYDQAQRALYVVMFNHLISAFEAFVTTRNRNKDLLRAESEFARLHVRARLKSIYAWQDTPFLNVTYQF